MSAACPGEATDSSRQERERTGLTDEILADTIAADKFIDDPRYHEAHPTALPGWIRPLGLAEHFIVGGALAAILAGLGTPAAARVVAVAAVGIAHELGDGDFTKPEGAPWNGILDVLAFLPVPLVWWAL